MPEINILGLFSSGYTLSSRSYCMEISMNAIDFSNIFFFRANDLTTINEDVSYCVDPNNWPDISFSEGLVKKNNKDIPSHLGEGYKVKDFGPNWLAYNISGLAELSHTLFANNDELVDQYVQLDSSVDPSGMKQLIQTNLTYSGSFGNPLSNSDTNIRNITRDILLHFLQSEDPNIIFRLDEMMTGDEEWKSIIFRPNDIIQFDIIYDTRIFGWQNYQVEDQDYCVKIFLN